MKKKIVSVILGGATLGAVLAGSMSSATALTSRSVNLPGQSVTWRDTGVTPAWAVLEMNLSTFFPAALVSNNNNSTYGLIYGAQLSWTCSGGFTQTSPQQYFVQGDNDGIVGNCPGGQFATSAFGVVDELE